MHEVSLNRLITDYITGQEIMDTTYEDLRQALARMLVEDKKYPRACVQPKHIVHYEIAGEPQEATIDIAVMDASGNPLLAMFFCPGEVGTFIRESLAAARVHDTTPFPLVAVTDSMEIQLVATHSGEVIGSGFYALPIWSNLHELAREHPCPVPSTERLAREKRILYAYDGLGGPCCGGQCSL